MNTNRILLLGLMVALSVIFVPDVSFAASKRPSVTTILPERNAVYDRTDIMPIRYELKNITRDMVVETDIRLVREDRSGPPVGYISGSGYHHVVYQGAVEGEFEEHWGDNDVIPGVYAITQRLHECSPRGCPSSPAGKAISKKSKPVYVHITNAEGRQVSKPADGVTFAILSPEGGEEFKSNKTLKVKWEADGVPSRSVVCVTLIQKDAGKQFLFPGGKGCKKAKDGITTVKGPLSRKAGYYLAPGEYFLQAELIGKSTGGKDGPLLAESMVADEIRIR